jgi:hypothetical protein
MTVTLDEVRAVFDGLISGLKPEQASTWAFERIEAADNGQLEFAPLEAEEQIWDALIFLGGADLIDPQGDGYLYKHADFICQRP